MPDSPTDRRATDMAIGDTSRILAIINSVGFFLLAGLLLFLDIPDGNKEIVISVISIMATIQVGMTQYFFGSSKSAEVSQRAGIVARDKADSTVQDIAKAVAPATPKP